jgi:hypothetical protein
VNPIQTPTAWTEYLFIIIESLRNKSHEFFHPIHVFPAEHPTLDPRSIHLHQIMGYTWSNKYIYIYGTSANNVKNVTSQYLYAINTQHLTKFAHFKLLYYYLQLAQSSKQIL